MDLRKFEILIGADATQANKAFQDVGGRADALGSRMGKLGATIVSAFASKAIFNFASDTVRAASDLGESINAVNVTFGEASDGILKFGETAAETVGMSKQQFNEFAVSFYGFTRQIAESDAEISTVTGELTTRIADFASVMNLDIAEAAQVFQSSLAGQTEPIRKFGIDLSAAAVAAFAVESGISESAKTMTESEKVQARYALLMQETASSAGDFANTSDSLANQQRILAAKFEDAKASLGEQLLPIMQKVLEIVLPLVDAFAALPAPVQKVGLLTATAGSAFITASKGLQSLGMSAKAANLSLGAVGLVLGAATAIYGMYNKEKQKAVERTNDFVNALQAEAGGQEDATNKHIAGVLANIDLDGTYSKLGLTINDLAAVIKGESVPAYDEFVERSAELIRQSGANSQTLTILREDYGLTQKEVRDLTTVIAQQEKAYGDALVEIEKQTKAQEALGVETDAMRQATEEATAAQEQATQATKEAEQALQDLLNATLAQFNAQLNYESQTWRTKDALDEYTEAQIEATFGNLSAEEATRLVQEASNDAASAALSQAAAAAKLAEDQAKAEGKTLDAAEAARIQIAELEKVAQQLAPNDPLRHRLNQYINELNTIPAKKRTDVSIYETTYRTVVERIRQVRESGGSDAGLSLGAITANPGGQLRRAGGGPVHAGNAYVVGERGPELFVPTMDGSIVPSRSLMESLGTPGPRLTGGGATVVVNVNGSVTSERDLVETIRKGLLQAQKSGRQLVLS